MPQDGGIGACHDLSNASALTLSRFACKGPLLQNNALQALSEFVSLPCEFTLVNVASTRKI